VPPRGVCDRSPEEGSQPLTRAADRYLGMASYRSTRFGRFDINDGAALRFPDGVAGLAHLEWFAILKRRADSVFLWLQSLDDADVALPIVLPWAFHWDYEIELPDADLRLLGVNSADQLSIYCLVDVGDEMRSATVDLAAPLVINDETHVGRQLRHAGGGYSSRDPLFGDETAVTPVSMREEASDMVTVLERGEQQCEIGQRVEERAPRGGAVVRRAQEAKGEPDEAPAKQRGRDRVEPAERPQRDGHERGRHEQQRVDEDLTGARLGAAHGRQHRHAGARVVFVEQQSERPEVGRRPEEDDREERDRGRGDRAVDGRPGDEWGHGAGGSADHDVLRRPALQPDRVDEDVAGEAGECPDCGEPVHLESEQGHAGRRQHQAQAERGDRRHAAAGHRPRARALHERIDVAVVPVVDRARSARHERHAEHRPGDHAVARPAMRSERQRADRRDDDQQHDARLEQLPVVVRARRSLCPEARRGSETRRGAAGGHAVSLPLVRGTS
jgi:flagellar assembly factor FliW